MCGNYVITGFDCTLKLMDGYFADDFPPVFFVGNISVHIM